MSGLDIDAIRGRRDSYRDAYARMLRAGEPDSDRASDYPGARQALFVEAVDLAGDVPQLLDQIERERAALDEALATVREQAAEIERLRTELNDARFGIWIQDQVDKALDTAHGGQGAGAGKGTVADIELLQRQRDEARAAADDALQVIADLRGEAP